jgi:hypothetical protein
MYIFSNFFRALKFYELACVHEFVFIIVEKKNNEQSNQIIEI